MTIFSRLAFFCTGMFRLVSYCNFIQRHLMGNTVHSHPHTIRCFDNPSWSLQMFNAFVTTPDTYTKETCKINVYIHRHKPYFYGLFTQNSTIPTPPSYTHKNFSLRLYIRKNPVTGKFGSRDMTTSGHFGGRIGRFRCSFFAKIKVHLNVA